MSPVAKDPHLSMLLHLVRSSMCICGVKISGKCTIQQQHAEKRQQKSTFSFSGLVDAEGMTIPVS